MPPILFRRRPPQTNCPPDTVPDPANGSWLESQQNKGSIPRLTPPTLARQLHSLLPILYIPCQRPMPGYSKAPQGLSVLLRVVGIFTHIVVSPSPPPRQRSDRYAIRAGRNLPDKEFRYLRTVIVTAAVCRGFGSPLRPLRG